MKATNRMIVSSVVLSLAFFAGCNRDPGASTGPAGTAGDANHDHDHDHEAPHGGQIIDLGEEEYHAELTHDDATHAVGIFILDGSATNTVPIEAEAVQINVVVGNQPTQYRLLAKPQADDPSGRSSYFELVSEALCDAWDSPGAAARLNVTIDGKPFVGPIEAHEHDHE